MQKLILRIFIIASTAILLSAAVYLVAEPSSRAEQGKHVSIAELHSRIKASKSFQGSIYIQGNETNYTPAQIVEKAKLIVKSKAPKFPLANAYPVIWIDPSRSKELALVTFSNGFGKPMVLLRLTQDGSVSEFSEGFATE